MLLSSSSLTFPRPLFLAYMLTLSRYDAKRQEIEAWLMRMESRSERMGNAAAQAQADVLDFAALDTQQKEQKVCLSSPCYSWRQKKSSSILHSLNMSFLDKIWNSCPCSQRWGWRWNIDDVLLSLPQTFHAELHTYKHHIELFNQLTQKLIAVYPGDDTSRIKRMTESVNLR